MRQTHRPLLPLAALLVLALAAAPSRSSAQAPPMDADIEVRVSALLAQMTLAEKVGQLTQYSGTQKATGPVTFADDRLAAIRAGLVGSVLNVTGADNTRYYQQLALQSRLKIPLLIAQDVIHGYVTTFPIPLAEAASWDLDAMRLSAHVAASEAAAAGVHWTFAPMVDIARDPRWGRVMEGAGEDTWLGTRIAAARVQGFQGEKPGAPDSVLATAKHYVAYGAAVGGRDYNTTDMSERQLREVYLPPFRAAADAGVATFMNSFNDLNGVPATASRHLQREILKGEWAYPGFVVSDWGSIGEMVKHGVAANDKEAAYLAIMAGNDMDMESNAYPRYLAELVNEGRVPMPVVDEAVRRVLRTKFRIGLFDNPLRFSDNDRERRELADPEHAAAARRVARESIVLLKNEGGLLPLAPTLKKVAFIGPLAKATRDNMGGWSIELRGVDYDKTIPSAYARLQQRLAGRTELLYAQGCTVSGTDTGGFAEAVAVAREADVVLLSVGEDITMSGEAKSRSNIHLPGVQEELVRAIAATGKPVVLMVSAGRPLVLEWAAEHIPTIVYTWWLGSEAGNAITDVLTGEYNPSGKLPMSFPRSEGQIPIYYNHPNTGRPPPETIDKSSYHTGYIDLAVGPRWAFGHGLGYTSFAYEGIALNRHELHGKDSVEVSAVIQNTGARTGTEVAQLYIRDLVASVVRPVQELRGFERITLAPGERRTVRFTLDRNALSFWNEQLKWVAEPGEFQVMVGAASDDIRLRETFTLAD
jgi:beta-glucosidase